jgi:hypothetical protein
MVAIIYRLPENLIRIQRSIAILTTYRYWAIVGIKQAVNAD